MLEASFVRVCFGISCVLTLAVSLLARETRGQSTKHDASFRSFQRLYLTVYWAATFSDWLQGPYIYAIYESYGISAGDNAILFVVGFGSSMVLGTWVGSMADTMGRKKTAIVYCVCYIVHNLTKHVNDYHVLLLGRLCGGIATSLLFCVFDSWLVSEHNSRGFDPELLSKTLSLASFGNAIGAVLAGIVAELAANVMEAKEVTSALHTPLVLLLTSFSKTATVHIGGYCTPFDVSNGILGLCAILIKGLWTENYGQQDHGQGQRRATMCKTRDIPAVVRSWVAAGVWPVRLVFNSCEIFCCGVVCSLFEASMFIFIFQWTPALTEAGAAKPPYGMIFATFMVPCMLGSKVFGILARSFSAERIGQGVLLVALGSHALPAVSSSPEVCFCAFLFFDFAVGMYFPMIGTLKGAIVPEASRSTIYSIYRVPLNFIVVAALVQKCDVRTAFSCTTVMLGVALVAQLRLVSALRRSTRPGAASARFCDPSVDRSLDLEAGVGAMKSWTSELPAQHPRAPTTIGAGIPQHEMSSIASRRFVSPLDVDVDAERPTGAVNRSPQSCRPSQPPC